MKSENAQASYPSFPLFFCFPNTVPLCKQSLTLLNIDLALGLSSIYELSFAFCDNVSEI